MTPNIKKMGDSQLWRAGMLPQPIRACEPDWPRRSLAVIDAQPSDEPARKLAIQLLDRGSADVVLLGVDWVTHIGDLIQEGGASVVENQQLLIILPEGTPLPNKMPDFEGRYVVVSSA